MDEITLPQVGRWILLLVQKSLCPSIFSLAARLAERGPLLVLDGGNQFNAYHVARAARGRPEILKRIRVSRAFTCYQMTTLLESTTISSSAILLLDFLATFYDENASFPDRRRLLQICLSHIRRLSLVNGVAVIVHPPSLSSPQATQLIERLANEADGVWASDMPRKPPEPLRLF